MSKSHLITVYGDRDTDVLAVAGLDAGTKVRIQSRSPLLIVKTTTFSSDYGTIIKQFEDHMTDAGDDCIVRTYGGAPTGELTVQEYE